jgi:hypothetical protein
MNLKIINEEEGETNNGNLPKAGGCSQRIVICSRIGKEEAKEKRAEKLSITGKEKEDR